MYLQIKENIEYIHSEYVHCMKYTSAAGAVKILRNLDAIDFTVLMSGKICYDEVSRIKRVVRRELIKLPVFMHNMKEYLRKLQKMKVLNGLNLSHPHYPVPNSYFLRQKVIESQKNPVSRKVSIESKTTSLSDNSDISSQGSLIHVFMSSPEEESTESSDAGDQKHSSSSSANKTESD